MRKKVVKKLLAFGIGSAMLGATVMGAMAADLSAYPSSFQTDGVFNGYFVVGEAAKPIDNLAMTDIATAMWYNKPSAKTTTTVQGDAWKVGTSAKKLEMANNNASASSIRGETIVDISKYISKDELKALAQGTYKTGESAYTYSQYVYFTWNGTSEIGDAKTSEIVKYVESDDDVTDTFFYVQSGKSIGRYKLEFSSSAESDVVDVTTGSASTTGLKLDDFEDTKINMFGKEYNVVLARRPSSSGGGIKLTLMGGAVSGTLLEGESKTYDLSGSAYEIALSYTDNTYAKFTVNGESTSKLAVGDTFKLSDGKEVGVSEVLYQAYAGGVHSAGFFLGANKVVLQDNAIISNDATDHELDVGGETIDGADVIIKGSDDNTTFKISTVEVNMTAQDDYYVPTNGKLSEVIKAAGDDHEVLFTNNWDFEFKGLAEVDSHDIKLDSNTDRKYNIIFYDGDNKKVSLPFLYAKNNTDVLFSEEATEKFLVLNETLSIQKNDYFVVTGGTAANGDAVSYALQYKGADKISSTSPKISFKNLGSGETLEYAVDTAAASNAVGDIKLGGYTFTITNTSTKDNKDCDIQVALNDVANGAMIPIVDYNGATFTVRPFEGNGATGSSGQTGRWNWSNNVNVTIWTENGNDYDNVAPMIISMLADATATNEVTLSAFINDGATSSLLTPEGEENVAYGYTTMGGKVTYATPSSSPYLVTYNYPKEQKLPQLYVTSGAVTSSSESGDLALVQVVDATRLDTEITDLSAQNLIVVGGPCVNSVAAKLLENPADCTEGFSPGKARIKMFANGEKLAMLVAGYSGEDTRLAGKVVAHRAADVQKGGSEVVVEGTTYSDATIGAPVVAEKTEEAASTPASS